MESNVLSWNTALERGYEPKLYPYTVDHIPIGEYMATLDFKIWAKKAMAVCCYFTQADSGRKFQLTVFRRQKDKLYALNESNLDFKFCNSNCLYNVSVSLKENGKVVFKNAAFISP